MTEQTGTVPTVRDVANIAERTVISLPQDILSFLLAAALPAGGVPGDAPELSGEGGEMVRITDAARYIATDFIPAFEAAAGPMNQALAEAHDDLNRALNVAAQKAVSVAADAGSPHIRSLADHARDVVAPAVAVFHGALFTQVVASEKSSSKLAQDVDAGALEQIDTIARQISFIAVNASVEAARVGDHGRGFAVIAAEIKSLSEKSRHAVKRMRAAVS